MLAVRRRDVEYCAQPAASGSCPRERKPLNRGSEKPFVQPHVRQPEQQVVQVAVGGSLVCASGRTAGFTVSARLAPTKFLFRGDASTESQYILKENAHSETLLSVERCGSIVTSTGQKATEVSARLHGAARR